MATMGRTARIGRALATGFAVAALATAGAVVFRSDALAAETTDLDALERYWQGRYRDLRTTEARLVETVRLATKEYADANRRTYRRSGVRHFHRTNANEAKAELEVVRAQIARTFDEVVAAGGSVNWLYEVDDEPRDPNVEGLGVYRDDGRFGGKGAYAPEPADDDEPVERGPAAGRNPLYYGEDDEPAKLDEGEQDRFDYDAWSRDRDQYEKERAPEEPLAPEDLEAWEED